MPRKSHTRASRRDRRKAKQSEFAREGTTNPRKKGHHMYETPSSAAEEKPTTVSRVCREDPRLHEFTLFPDLGVKACSGCGLRQKMAESEFIRGGNSIRIPDTIRQKVAKPTVTQPGQGTEKAVAPPVIPCRSGEHDLRKDPELGIRVCRNCDFFTK